MSDVAWHIRRAVPADGADVGPMWMSLLDEQARLDERLHISEDALDRWKNDFREWIHADVRRVLVAEVEGEVVGFASAHITYTPPIYEAAREVFLDEVYVKPTARRKGVGSALVEAVRQWAVSVEAVRLRLAVLHANEPARAFWTAVGARAYDLSFTVELRGAA